MDALIVRDGGYWVTFSQICAGVGILIGNLFFLVLYLGKWPCIEQFKGSDEPWPWDSDPNWNKTLTKMILVSLFNILVTTIAFYILRITG